VTEFSNRQIPPPLNWEEFESLCCDLWSEILNDSNTCKNGRSGQVQNGVDVFGRRDGGGTWIGVQCKGKDSRYGKEVTERELKEEVTKAKSFIQKISEFILATTAENDAKIQKIARELTETNEKNGLFSVTVIGWSEIIRKLAIHESIVEKYYPNQSLQLKSLGKNVEDLVDASLLQNSHSVETNDKLSHIISILEGSQPSISFGDEHSASETDAIEEVYNQEIDGYRDTLKSGKSKTAKGLLVNLKDKCWDNVSDNIKFRIVTNIAACDIRLGNEAEATSGFRDAFQYAEDNEIANANLILADIMENDLSSAYEKAILAVKKFTNNETILSYYIASYPLEDKSFDPTKCVPDELADSSAIAYSIHGYYRRSSDFQSAREWIARAYSLDPEGFEIRFAYSSDLLEPFSLDQSVLVGEQISQEKLDQLSACKGILAGLFNEIFESEESEYFESISNNLALTHRLLGDNNNATDVVNKALDVFPDSEPLLRLRIALHIDLEEWQEALAILSEYGSADDFQVLLMKIETFRGLGDHAKARELVEQYLNSYPESDKKDFLNSYLVELMHQSVGYEAAIAHGERSVDKELSIQTYLAMSKAHRRNDNIAAAKKCTSIALKNMRVITPYGETFMIAEEAYFCELLIQAKKLFTRLTLEYVDSPPLRRLTACLYELDDRPSLIELFDKLPAEVIENSFYSKYSAAFFTKIGDDERAEQEINRYLSNHPSDLNAALNKIGILYRTNRPDQAEEFVDSLVDIQSQPPLDQMNLAFVCADLGKESLAMEMAYHLRRKHSNNPDIHQKYVGLIFSGRTSGAILEYAKVEAKTSVVVKHGDTLFEYYICGEDDNPQGDNELLINHPISHALLGAKVGEIVEYDENPITKRTVKIIEIKSKYIYLLHDTMDKFSHRFPAAHSMFKLELEKDSDGHFDFSPIFKSLDQRRSYVDQGMNIYKNNPMPVAMLAKYLNVEPINLWFGLQNERDVSIYCAQGTHAERQAAFNIIENPKNYIVDPLTAVHIVDLGIIDVIQSVLGKLSITRSALDLIEKVLEEERQFGDKQSMTIAKVGDDYVKHETSGAEIEAKADYLESIKNTLKDRFCIVSAIGSPSSSQEMNQFLSNIDPSFIDTIYASANDGCCLLSDDLRLRGLAQLGWKIDSIWVQPVLMTAVDKSLIEASRYSEIIYQYINRNFDFISVDRHVLYNLAKENKFKVSDKFLIACRTLGLDRSDLKSSISVAEGTMNDIWPDCIDDWSYEAFVYAILNSLTADCTKTHTTDLLRYLDSVTSKVVRGPFSRAIRKWTKGHFLIRVF